ncbi:MAG: arylsulfotransferase family protein [Candidatus Eremiobacteraeota bacterium]|nr:arylsulfotransferase family protein [Candidatus Eremiobacteraeota bacterium]
MKVVFWIFLAVSLGLGIYYLSGAGSEKVDFGGNAIETNVAEDPPVEFTATLPGYGDPGNTTPEPTETPGIPRKTPRATKSPKASKSPQGGQNQILTLPYLSRVPIAVRDRGKSGVMTYKEKECYDGLNLYASKWRSEARLMDMRGKVVHRWAIDSNNEWQNTVVDPQGNLYFLEVGVRVGKLDWYSNYLWTNDREFHHWIDIAKNGDIYTLIWDKYELQYDNRLVPALTDFLAVLSPKGEMKKAISVYELLGSQIPKKRLKTLSESVYMTQQNMPPMPGGDFDLFHTNTIVKIERDIPGLCKKGDMLICVRQLDTVAIVDPDRKKVLWQWGPGVLSMSHSPVLLDNNNILVFDNGTVEKHFSRIVEVDPFTKKIVYEYKGNPPQDFYTVEAGAVQALPNGNMLITESNRGKVFEVTRSGKVVWEFYNPDIESNQRSTIFRMTRLDKALSEKLLKKVKKDESSMPGQQMPGQQMPGQQMQGQQMPGQQMPGQMPGQQMPPGPGPGGF